MIIYFMYTNICIYVYTYRCMLIMHVYAYEAFRHKCTSIHDITYIDTHIYIYIDIHTHIYIYIHIEFFSTYTT